MDIKSMSGEIARSNGILFEKNIYDLIVLGIRVLKEHNKTIKLDLNNITVEDIIPVCNTLNLTDIKSVENIISFFKDLNKYYIFNINNITVKLISNEKVSSISNKLTTSKSDIVIYNNDIPIPISIKMSNKGTQYQIISLDNFLIYLNYKNIYYNDEIIKVWKKFLGLIPPSLEELVVLNQFRKEEFKNKNRYWLCELTQYEKITIELFLYKNKKLLIEFCLKNGMCLHNENKAELFLLNNDSYTETKNINFVLLDFKDFYKKLNKGKCKITKNGNLQLTDYIGIQRKGSGIGNSSSYIQFKDRGYKHILEPVMEQKIENKLRGLSLFACAGIAEYYLRDTKLEIVIANELLQERCNIYKHFYPNTQLIQGDIINNIESIIKLSKELKVDFIIGTPPCQTFSNAGKKKINDVRTPLFLSLIKCVKEIKPKYVLIENVPSFMKSIYDDTKTTILEKFKIELSGQYNIITDVLDSKDYEVPQSRKRSITLLSLKQLPVWNIPIKINNIKTVRQTIGHLPSLKSGESSLIHKWHKAKTHNENHIKWMTYTPTGKSAFDNKVHYPQKDGRVIKGYKTTYKRIEWDKPAPTITMSSGSISSQNNVHPGNLYVLNDEKIYDNARTLTVYEIMLLTGLDDTWVPPTDNEKLIRDIIGEAIPPRFLYNIIKSLP